MITILVYNKNDSSITHTANNKKKKIIIMNK